MSLAQLQQTTTKKRRARRDEQSYNWFTEGFDTKVSRREDVVEKLTEQHEQEAEDERG